MIKREQFYIDSYKLRGEVLYNLSPTAGNNLGLVRSEESRVKMSKIMKGREWTEKRKRRKSEDMKGKPSNRKGKKASKETREKISKVQKGRKHSKETKQKISKAHKGKKNTLEHNKHISEAKKKLIIEKPWLKPPVYKGKKRVKL